MHGADRRAHQVMMTGGDDICGKLFESRTKVKPSPTAIAFPSSAAPIPATRGRPSWIIILYWQISRYLLAVVMVRTSATSLRGSRIND
jgi:hypothetical protein